MTPAAVAAALNEYLSIAVLPCRYCDARVRDVIFPFADACDEGGWRRIGGTVFCECGGWSELTCQFKNAADGGMQ